MSDREEEFENFIAQSCDFARNNDKNSLEIMLNAGLNVNLANHKGNTLLMLAAYNNSLDVAEMLLQKGQKLIKRMIKPKHLWLACVSKATKRWRSCCSNMVQTLMRIMGWGLHRLIVP